MFARKVIRPFGYITTENVLNEVRAVGKLCKPGGHKNIVPVFQYGAHSTNPYYFLDMELCDLNLNAWIARKWDVAIQNKMPYFTGNLSAKINMTQIWAIMEDITNGVAFIHSKGETHRDLKPANDPSHSKSTNNSVLYSHQDHAWKIADFGLTIAGSSRRVHTTHNSRGTSSYRAPELIRGNYNNKVDVFAIGCILYEVVFRRKALADDLAVVIYSESNQSLALPFESDTLPDKRRKAFVSNIIYETFDVEATQRPRAEELSKRFIDSADASWLQNPQGN